MLHFVQSKCAQFGKATSEPCQLLGGQKNSQTNILPQNYCLKITGSGRFYRPSVTLKDLTYIYSLTHISHLWSDKQSWSRVEVCTEWSEKALVVVYLLVLIFLPFYFDVAFKVKCFLQVFGLSCYSDREILEYLFIKEKMAAD